MDQQNSLASELLGGGTRRRCMALLAPVTWVCKAVAAYSTSTAMAGPIFYCTFRFPF